MEEIEDIPQPAKRWLKSILGPYELHSAHRAGSNRTGVWKITYKNKEYFFKLHYDRRIWYSEVHAYQHYASAYKPYLPSVEYIFDQDTLQGLLVTSIPGKPLKDCLFDETTVTRVYQQAGALCKRLHNMPAGTQFGFINEQGIAVDYQGTPLDDKSRNPVDFIQSNLIELLESAQALDALTSSEITQAEYALDAMHVFQQERPTLVNMDYTPGNWLVDSKGTLVGIIDLEHVMCNVLVDAFTRLLVDNYTFGTRAFFEGYGSNPILTKQMQTRIVCIRHALYYVSQGAKNRNASWIRRGKQIFHKLDDLFLFANS